MDGDASGRLIAEASWVDPTAGTRRRGWVGLAVNFLLSVVTASPGQGYSSLRIRPALARRVERVKAGRREWVTVGVGEWSVLTVKRATAAGMTDDRRHPREVIAWSVLNLVGRTSPGSAPPGGPDTRAVGVTIDGRNEKLYADLQDLALIHVLCGQPFDEETWKPAEIGTE